MHESIRRFKAIHRNMMYASKPHVLLLNHMDEFRESILRDEGEPPDYTDTDGERPWKECPRRANFSNDDEYVLCAADYFAGLFLNGEVKNSSQPNLLALLAAQKSQASDSAKVGKDDSALRAAHAKAVAPRYVTLTALDADSTKTAFFKVVETVLEQESKIDRRVSRWGKISNAGKMAVSTAAAADMLQAAREEKQEAERLKNMAK